MPGPAPRSATCTFLTLSLVVWLAYVLPYLVLVVTFTPSYVKLLQQSRDPAESFHFMLDFSLFYLHDIYQPLSGFLTDPQWWPSEIIRLLVRISRRKREKASLEQTGGHGINYPQPQADEWMETHDYNPLFYARLEPGCASKQAPF